MLNEHEKKLVGVWENRERDRIWHLKASGELKITGTKGLFKKETYSNGWDTWSATENTITVADLSYKYRLQGNVLTMDTFDGELTYVRKE